MIDRILLGFLGVGVWFLVLTNFQSSAANNGSDFERQFEAALSNALLVEYDFETRTSTLGPIPTFINENCHIINGDDVHEVPVRCDREWRGERQKWKIGD